MQATRIYKMLDKLSITGEFSDAKQLLHVSKNLYQAFLQWDCGDLKDSYFLNYLNKIADKRSKE